MNTAASSHVSKVRLLDAALRVIRSKGYAATRIEDICDAAALTKGSFFHHFRGKEELALAAAGHFGGMADGVFSTAPYQAHADPLDRLLGYIDFRIAILQGELPDYTCLLGTLVQEVYDTHPAIREACDTQLRAQCTTIEMASLNLNIGPPLRASNCTPSSSKLPTSTEPSGPGPPLPLRVTLRIFEFSKIDV